MITTPATNTNTAPPVGTIMNADGLRADVLVSSPEHLTVRDMYGCYFVLQYVDGAWQDMDGDVWSELCACADCSLDDERRRVSAQFLHPIIVDVNPADAYESWLDYVAHIYAGGERGLLADISDAIIILSLMGINVDMPNAVTRAGFAR